MKRPTRAATYFIALTALGALFLGCNRDHKPFEHWKAIRAESTAANRPSVKLTQAGELPVKSTGGSAAVAGSGNPKFDTLCASCHGLDGKADTPAANALSPKPRNFTDKKWQGSVDDARIAKVIKEGGASVGLSPTMAPWGAMLSEQEVTDLVKVIRKLGE